MNKERIKDTVKQITFLESLNLNECIIMQNENYNGYRVFNEKTKTWGGFTNDPMLCRVHFNDNDFYKFYNEEGYVVITKKQDIDILNQMIEKYKDLLEYFFNDIIKKYGRKYYIIEYKDNENNIFYANVEIYAIITYKSYGCYGLNGAHSDIITDKGIYSLRHYAYDDIRFDNDGDLITHNENELECKYKDHPKTQLLKIKKA